ncbi:MAG TPA: prepilin-type N-terminal cleavage/methylation domain-containing protein [Phycisphaerae bacterium]|nr:prepilin-type N-terminal cleavage/methylation domain-containing protein [Phycisphaerae bacterium]
MLRKWWNVRGFTLTEVLVVVAITALLLAILLPSLARARLRSHVVVVHSDLRHITVALDAYAMEHRDQLPPTRQSCGTRILYQLPMELAVKKYLPSGPGSLKRAFFEDLFNRGQTYRYRAPGAVWQNGTLMDFPDSTWRPRARIWVPDDAPRCESTSGKYFANRTHEGRSPVTYAVWSMGPEPDSARFPHWEDGTLDESEMPLPRRFWFTNEGRASGLITRFRMRQGLTYTSP